MRSQGSIPATIGIVGGRIKIGLRKSELEQLAVSSGGRPPSKISRRDIGPALAMGANGGTTCSATLIFAAMAGIKVFYLFSNYCSVPGVYANTRSSQQAGKSVDAAPLYPSLSMQYSLGGVHRGGENSMDVSADLQELTRCSVGLVSAGVKSILDIERLGLDLPS